MASVRGKCRSTPTESINTRILLLSRMCRNKPKRHTVKLNTLIDAQIYQIHLERTHKCALMMTVGCIYYTYKSNQVHISNKI